MENKRPQQSSNNGFILGIIIGVVITLLFVTKKGRKMLSRLADEGMDIFSDLENLLKEAETTIGKDVKQATEPVADIVKEVTKTVQKEVEKATEKVESVVEEIKELPLLQMLEEQVVAVKKSPVVEETIKEVKETIEEIPHMPLIKDMEKEVQTRVEQVLESDLVQSTQEKVEELVEKVQEAQSDLQAVKEELVQSVKTLEKKPVRRFFKGIRRNK